MTTGLVTLGFEGPATSSGGGGGGGPASEIVIGFSMVNTAGSYTAGLDLSGVGIVQVSINGGNYANRVGAAPTSFGGGDYYYIPDVTEVPSSPGKIFLKVVLSGYEEVHTYELIDTSVADAVAAINATTVTGISATAANISSSQTAIAGDITTAVSTINTNTDTELTTTQTTIISDVNSNTTSALAATQTALSTDITNAVTSIDASTATTVAASQTAIISAIPTPSQIANAILNAARADFLSLGSIGEGIALATSLLQGNFMIDNVVNTGNGPTSQRIRCWTSAAGMSAATPGGTGQGEFATFAVTTTYAGPNAIQTHQVVQQ
jgi:hypothetical protein